MSTTEIINLAGALAAPLGITASLLAGLVLLTGRARLLSAAALALILLTAALISYTELNQLTYRTRQSILTGGLLTLFAAAFAFYLRNTHFPTALKWVNRPATWGIGASFALFSLSFALHIITLRL